jgi:ATP-binding cassette subfamily C protein
MKSNIKILSYFFDNRDYPKIFILILFLIITTFLEAFSLGMLIPISYNILGISSSNLNNENLLKFISIFTFSKYSYVNLIIFLGIFIFKNILLFYFQKYRIDFFSQNFLKNSKKIYHNYLNKNFEETLLQNKNQPNQIIINEMRTLTERFFNPIIVIISEILLLVFFIIFLILSGQYYIYYLLIFFGFLAFFYTRVMDNFFQKIGEKRRINEYKSRVIVSEGLSGFKEIFLLKKQKFYLNRFFKFSKNYINAHNIFSYFTIIPRLVLETVIVIFFSIFVILTIIYSKEIPLESIVIFLIMSYRLLPILGKLALNFNYLRFSLPIFTHFSKENFITSTEKKNFKENKKVLVIKDKLIIQNLSFKFRYSKEYIIKNLNFEMKKSSITGIFGPSGSGKTTLINLIAGLLTPTSGKILLDNLDINKFINNYHYMISYIPQDPFIMNDTLQNNITFGKRLNFKEKKKLNFCIKKTGIDCFFNQDNSTKGLNFFLSECGNNISGGQKQKIAIARALFNEKSILILDESTSALDKKSENEILKLVHELKGGKIVIIISHDKNVISHADKVINI